jgi:hypothetical protein
MSNIKDIVQEKYAETARRVLEGNGLPADCCLNIPGIRP